MFPRHTNKTETGSDVKEEAISDSSGLSVGFERM